MTDAATDLRPQTSSPNPARTGRVISVSLVMALALLGDSLLYVVLPLHGAARRYEDMTREALTATIDRNARSFAPIALAVYHAGIGGWEKAAENAAESARIALEVGFRRRREDAMSIGGFIEHMRWQPAAARRIYADLNESARRGSQRGLIWSTSALAVIALRTGDQRGAETRLRELESLHPGGRVTLQGVVYEVADVREAEVVAGEGELPFRVDAGWKTRTADLRTATARFATLDYSDARPRLYTGEVVELAALAPRGLRELEGSR